MFAIVSFGASSTTTIEINEVCCMWQVVVVVYVYLSVSILSYRNNKNLNKNYFTKQKNTNTERIVRENKKRNERKTWTL